MNERLGYYWEKNCDVIDCNQSRSSANHISVRQCLHFGLTNENTCLIYPWIYRLNFNVNILSWENSWVRSAWAVWVPSSVLILALKILSRLLSSKTIKNLSKTRQKRRSHTELFARIQNGHLWHCINFYPNNCLLLVIYYLAILFYILRTMEKNAKLQTKTSNSSRHQNWRSHLSC